MNRKKALLLVSLIEMIVILIFTVLYVMQLIPFKLFITLFVLVALLTSTLVFAIIRKFNS